MLMTSRAELAALEATIATAPSAIVAFSGGSIPRWWLRRPHVCWARVRWQ